MGLGGRLTSLGGQEFDEPGECAYSESDLHRTPLSNSPDISCIYLSRQNNKREQTKKKTFIQSPVLPESGIHNKRTAQNSVRVSVPIKEQTENVSLFGKMIKNKSRLRCRR